MMKTILVTGGIGSGKSAVCSFLSSLGVPVYDCDSEAKSLYFRKEGLLDRVEAEFGTRKLSELGPLVFGNPDRLAALEALVHPALFEDFDEWRASQNAPFVVMESAILLARKYPEGLFDMVVYVDADRETRLERAMTRDGATKESIMKRMANQAFGADDPRIDLVMENAGSLEELKEKTEKLYKSLI